ncbi:MAG: right-handed parallel beta-helix repeat-containing protein, partial [Cyclobacteriaceae bacterium]|nr:right-handed parallel beta-helix repeat-containing protein [Cyclobacteriaceae bacterium]
KPIGIYYLEERFDKYLVENNSLREGILFKLDSEFSPYQESKLMSDPGTKAQLLMVKGMWQDVMAGDLPPGCFFDLKKMAQVFALCDLMNSKHPLAGQNMRLYFNPVTGLAEPIVREWETLERRELSNLRLFPEKPIPLTRHAKFVNDPILKLIYDNLEFKRQYAREAEILCQTKFLDQLLLRNEDKINSLLDKVYRTWPFYKLPTHKLYENQNYMRSVLFPKDDQLAAYFSLKNSKTLQLSLHNQQYLPIEVTHLSWRDSILFHPKTHIVLDSKDKEQPQLFNFELPDRLQLPKDYLKDIKVHYYVYGLESGKRTIGVLFQAGDLKSADREENLVKKGTYSSFYFVKTDEDNEFISIPAGEWTISKDLVIPANKQLEIAAGAHIDLIKGASIISYSPIYVKGQEEISVSIISSDSSSQGVHVIQADQRSQLSHVIFDKLAGPTTDGGMLQGAVTFFESPVSIYVCTFSNGRTGNDYLHIRRSDFSLEHSLFKNIDGNALGVNYCSGVISNSSFVNIGMDGIATISGKIKIQQLFFNNIGKQGLLARENSQLTIRWADIRHAEIGIVATGQSKVRIFDTLLEHNNIGVTIYEENSVSDMAFIKAERLEIKDTAMPYQIETGAKMILNGAPLGKG